LFLFFSLISFLSLFLFSLISFFVFSPPHSIPWWGSIYKG
jgi:hypothetical protein